MKITLVVLLTNLILFTACVSGGKYREEREVRRDFEERYLQYQGETERLGRYASELEGRLGNLQAEYDATNAALAETQRERAALRAQVDAYENQSTALQQEQSARAEQLAAQEAQLKTARERVDAVYRAVGDRDVQLMEVISALDRHYRGNAPENLSFEQREGAVVLTILNDQLFRPGQTRVKTDGKNLLQEIVPLLLVRPGLNFHVRVHADGTKDDLTTSALRAVAVAKILIDNEVLPNRIRTVGMGDAYAPYDPNDPATSGLNRRTEIVVRGDERALNALLSTSGG